jgi:hypothetical protein
MWRMDEMIIKKLIYCLGLGGCIGLSVIMSCFVIFSWSGGNSGLVTATFNQHHERLAETIIFPLWTICGFIASYDLIKGK